MTHTVAIVLLLFALLEIKHMLADYFLQTRWMLQGRGGYLHLGRAAHAGVHALGSVIVFLIVGAPLGFIACIVVLEWIVHFHIDFWKASFSEKKCLTPDQAAFWRAAGFDQWLHHMTYVAMTWAWVKFAI
ncbi:DUF3307 domain-containing protein [Chachezhania sediminis]|uniref:DUF3307 domain-containing protein n=1 Tax=Chachezhania sediminis TaxID=2599291 RepID=UPI00131C2AE4|nr:DUF3307 domain-containing protein [Chachezhania sediminis]